MNVNKRLSKVYLSSKAIPVDDTSKLVLMSDCHRGDGSWADNFARNQTLYAAALHYYYNNGYLYFELGDGDELWENKRLCDILRIHTDVFWILYRLYMEKRAFFIYGNHDMVKKSPRFVRSDLSECEDAGGRTWLRFFSEAEFRQGLVLKYRPSKTGPEHPILLLHGHQADFFNDQLWKCSRFLVRYLWKPLELIGVNDPTSTSKNHDRKEVVETLLTDWADKNRVLLVAGHTHRAVFPEAGKSLYFNDGSCVGPYGITSLEIEGGYITLVKWRMQTRPDGTLYVGKEIMAGPSRLAEYFEPVPAAAHAR